MVLALTRISRVSRISLAACPFRAEI
jgi:hypothetical protein